MFKFRLTGVLSGALLGGILVIVGTTHAAAEQAENSGEQHCIESVETGNVSCFSSFADSLTAATGGAIKFGATTSEQIDTAELSKALTPNSPQTSYVHVILWTGPSHTGSSLTLHATYVCGSTGTATWTYFQAPWNNNFESGWAYSGCKVRLYDGNTAAGSPSYLIGTDASVNSFVSFNNQASSARSCGSALACA